MIILGNFKTTRIFKEFGIDFEVEDVIKYSSPAEAL